MKFPITCITGFGHCKKKTSLVAATTAEKKFSLSIQQVRYINRVCLNCSLCLLQVDSVWGHVDSVYPELVIDTSLSRQLSKHVCRGIYYLSLLRNS